jgi:hypothetical protein
MYILKENVFRLKYHPCNHYLNNIYNEVYCDYTMIFFNLHPSGLLVPNEARPTANDGETEGF